MTSKKKRSNEELLNEITQILGEQVPVEIKNYEAYLEYLKLHNNPIHKLTLTIAGEKVPISHPLPAINKRLRKALERELITEEEAAHIKQRKLKQQGIKMKCMALLKKAYGTVVNQYGEKIVYASVFENVKEQMIELFGRMFTGAEVHEVCLTRWNLKVTLNQVNDFRRTHINEINKKVEEHQRTYSDIRLGHKRSRLEELVWLYNKRKKIYELSNKGEDHRLLLSTLEQIKKEAEGDVLRIDGNITVGLENTIDEHIKRDLAKTIPLKEIVISRVASRTNADPVKLMKYISDSIYRKALDSAEDAEFVEMPQYPSLQNYDFDTIRRIQEQEEQKKQLEAKIDTGPSEIVLNQAEELRKQLLKKLIGKEEKLNVTKNKLIN